MLPVLETERLILRPINKEDAFDMYEYARTTLVGPKAGWAPHNSVYETTAIISLFIQQAQRTGLGVYAIVLKETNKMVGTIELFNLYANFKAEMGYALNPRYWGMGIIPEAGRAVLAWGFNELNLKRIEINLFVDNIQSERVCQKLGLSFEGIIRNGYMRYDGLIFDEKKYSITDTDFHDLYLKDKIA